MSPHVAVVLVALLLPFDAIALPLSFSLSIPVESLGNLPHSVLDRGLAMLHES